MYYGYIAYISGLKTASILMFVTDYLMGVALDLTRLRKLILSRMFV